MAATVTSTDSWIRYVLERLRVSGVLACFYSRGKSHDPNTKFVLLQCLKYVNLVNIKYKS